MSAVTGSLPSPHATTIDKTRKLEKVADQEKIPPERFLELIKNGTLALGDHYPGNALPFSKADQIVPLNHIIKLFERTQTPFAIQVDFDAKQGQRPSMEDALFVTSFRGGNALAGIFDGHNGNDVADYANREFERMFPQTLDYFKGDVDKTFQYLFNAIHTKLSQYSQFDLMGSTAVLTFIRGSLIYTATLGDSEAKIYRNGTVIPLSRILNWGCVDAAERAERAYIEMGDPAGAEAARKWRENPNQEKPRFGRLDTKTRIIHDLNVSHAIGDTYFDPAISHKPEITVQRVYSGDVVILASDGFWDVAVDSEVAKIIRNNPDCAAQKLTDYALKKGSKDNVSVIALTVCHGQGCDNGVFL